MTGEGCAASRDMIGADSTTPVTSLNSSRERVCFSGVMLAIAKHARRAPNGSFVVTVVPRPGPDGTLPAEDGRRNHVRNTGYLVDLLNRQQVQARFDEDHRSEPSSETFAGSTASLGWLSNYRQEAGEIVADLDPTDEALSLLRSVKYRYLSPAYYLSPDDEVIGLSSLALTNRPNFPMMFAPSLNRREAELGRGQAELARGQAELAREQEQAVVGVVDMAIATGAVPAHHREHYIREIRAHPDGLTAGMRAFQVLQPGRTVSGAAGGRMALHQRIVRHAAETGLTYRAALMAVGREDRDAALGVPCSAVADGERIGLHYRIRQMAAAAGLSYRQAAIRMAASEFVIPAGLGPHSPERVALHERVRRFADRNGMAFREAVMRWPAVAATVHGEEDVSSRIERLRRAAARIIQSVFDREAAKVLEIAKDLARFADRFAAAGDHDRAMATVAQAEAAIRNVEDAAGRNPARARSGARSPLNYWLTIFPPVTEETAGRELQELERLGLITVDYRDGELIVTPKQRRN